MENVEKLRQVEKAIQKAIDVHLDNLEPIAKKSGSFEYIQCENMDDAFEFKLYGVEFSKIHEEYVECQDSNDFVDNALKDKFDTEIDAFTDNVPESTDWGDDQIKALKRLMLLAQATVIADLEESLSDANMEQIQTNLEAIEKEISGFDYDCWEETELLFSVDGINYRMSMWCGELSNRESGLCIDEIEEEQKKVNKND